jgi:hypothetical protein
MDIIREQLLYKENSLTICLETLTTQEHYEIIRLLLASRTKGVTICVHSIKNPYILKLMEKLNLPLTDCSASSQSLPQFDRLAQET